MANQHQPLVFVDPQGNEEKIYKTHLLPKPVRPNRPKLKPENPVFARPKKAK